MSGFLNQERREQLDLLAKWIIAAIGAWWTFYAGTDLIEKDSATLELENKALSAESLPTVDHTIEIFPNNPKFVDNGECYVAGKFVIPNAGKLALEITHVDFEVYALPFVALQEGDYVASSGTMKLIDAAKPIYTETIKRTERIGAGNKLERLFNFTLRDRTDARYALVARAHGGIALRQDASQSIRAFSSFKPHDVEHILSIGRQSCPGG
ncbi:MAG: hypothetical protein H2049_07410 [Porphyrobacter sp.]|nr:hypothetical protein [Porphyrobacter sp.]